MRIKLLVGTAWLASVFISTMQAATLFQHTGSNNPATEGWTVFQVGTLVTAGPVANDLGTGLSAWAVSDPTILAGALAYQAFPTAGDAASASTFGWSLAANLRVVRVPHPIPGGAFTGSVYVEYIDGSSRFGMSFGSQADGDPIVQFLRGPAFALEGGGPGYHFYDLRYDPVAHSADLFIDGVERISDFPGFLPGFAPSSLTPGVTWGAFAQEDFGQGNYNLVEFAIVPEPSSTLLVICGMLLLVFWPKRRQAARSGGRVTPMAG